MIQKIGLTTKKCKKTKKEIYVYKLDVDDNMNDDNKMLSDPFISYGHGLMSFFRLLKFLRKTFMIITIINIPLMLMYYNLNPKGPHTRL